MMSMSKEIRIGKDSESCSWIRVFELPDWFHKQFGVAENHDSFTGDGVFGVRFYVNRNTPEGKKLAELIAEYSDKKNTSANKKRIIKKIQNHIEDFTFKHLTMEDILDIIEHIKKESFEEGKQAKMKEFRSVMGY